MQLRLASRPVGEVLIVHSHGRIVVGSEVNALRQHVQDSFERYNDIVIDLEGTEFIDSSGLGALVRLKQDARIKGSDLKLSRIPPLVRKTMQVTNLLSQFETYETVEEALTAAYMGPRYARDDPRPRVICVHGSSDVSTFLREVLWAAGFNALTAGNIGEAEVLLRATKAKSVVIPAHLTAVSGRSTKKLLQKIDPEVSVFSLDENFAYQEPAEAAEKLLHQLSTGRTASSAGQA